MQDLVHDYSLADGDATEFSFGAGQVGANSEFGVKFDSGFVGHPCQTALFECFSDPGAPFTVIFTDQDGVTYTYTATAQNGENTQSFLGDGPEGGGKVRSMQILHPANENPDPAKEAFKDVLECFADGECTFAELMEYCGALMGPLTKDRIIALFDLTVANGNTQWGAEVDNTAVFQVSEGGTVWTLCGDEFGTMPPGDYTMPEVVAWLNANLPTGYSSTLTPIDGTEQSLLDIVGPDCDPAPTFQFGDDEPVSLAVIGEGGGGNPFKALLECYGITLDDFLACVPVSTPRTDDEIKAIAQACVDALELPAPSDVVPVADNEDDAAIRTGLAGTSADYARADHNHPIRRQANPGAPTLVAGGNMTIAQSIPALRFWSDEEAVYFGQRYRVQQPAGTGWGWITMPNIPGFQRPILQELGTYRFPATAIQEDENTGAGGAGAGPRGAYMGSEMAHWSFTQRLYGGYLRRDNPVDMYVTLVIKYIRN